MNAHPPQTRASLTEVINSGIARRGFYIVSTPGEIPGCKGDKSAKLERIREFANENGWKITIHNGNGWILFSGEQFPVEQDMENGLGHLAELIENAFDSGINDGDLHSRFQAPTRRSRHHAEN